MLLTAACDLAYAGVVAFAVCYYAIIDAPVYAVETALAIDTVQWHSNAYA